MNTNPTTNAIAFKLQGLWGKEIVHIEPSSTQATDGIKNAWLAVQKKTGAQSAQVQEILSEWEPGEADAAFLDEVFPKARVSFYFKRPAADGWAQAFADAARSLKASASKESAKEQYKRFKEEKERRKTGETRLFPMLRRYQAGDFHVKTVVHRPVGPGLAVFLAYTSPTPQGDKGPDYVLQITVDKSEGAIDTLFETAWQNLRDGLQYKVGEIQGAKVVSFSHPTEVAASVLGLPEFYQQVRSRLGQDEMFVALPDSENLFVTVPNTPAADKLSMNVTLPMYGGVVTLTPSCYLLNSDGLRQVPPLHQEEHERLKEAKDRRKTGAAQLFPILRRYQADDLFTETIPYRCIGPDLAVFLAYAGPTPRGTIGIEYVLQSSIDSSKEAINVLFETAWQNLRAGLQLTVDESKGAKLLSFAHPNNMTASALSLPEFYQQMRSHLGQNEVFVAFPDPDNLFVTLPNTPAADLLREEVAQSDYSGAVALTPACYLLDGAGLRRVPPPMPSTPGGVGLRQVPPPLP